MIIPDWSARYDSMDDLIADFGIEMTMSGWYQFGRDTYLVANHGVFAFFDRSVDEVKAFLLWLLRLPSLPC